MAVTNNTLIIGSAGLVGSALARQLPRAVCGVQMEARAGNQRYMDITKYETLFKVFSEVRPKTVYLCAAIAGVDKCEETTTGIVNIRGVTTVLRLCEQFESKLVWYSSSYVFDGTKSEPYTEEDAPNPVQNYGVQKLQMERLIMQSDIKHLIIRTVGVFGQERKKKNFAQQVIRNTFAGREINVPNDQYMNPILSDDLASISVGLAQKNFGIYHVSGLDCVSKYEWAKQIASYFGYEHLVIPKSSADMKQAAKRPVMGCLDTLKLSLAGYTVPKLSGGMQKFLSKSYA